MAIGGRNKYLINGQNAQLQRVQNLFHSVGLNVNNPHFLIMQGRITKVLNMKPVETLGMIEEAAGTRMFELKKQQSIKIMEKKETKLDEIKRVRPPRPLSPRPRLSPPPRSHADAAAADPPPSRSSSTTTSRRDSTSSARSAPSTSSILPSRRRTSPSSASARLHRTVRSRKGSPRPL